MTCYFKCCIFAGNVFAAWDKPKPRLTLNDLHDTTCMPHNRFSVSYSVYTFIQVFHTGSQVTRIKCVTHASLELHTQKNTWKVSHTFTFTLEWTILKNVFLFKNATLCFTMVSVELQILFNFNETERKIHFVISKCKIVCFKRISSSQTNLCKKYSSESIVLNCFWIIISVYPFHACCKMVSLRKIFKVCLAILYYAWKGYS